MGAGFGGYDEKGMEGEQEWWGTKKKNLGLENGSRVRFH